MAKKNKKTAPRAVSAKPKPAMAELPEWFTNRRLHIWLLFLFSVLLYANTFTHEYAQDDAIVITDNMFTSEGVSGIPGILKYDTFYGFFKEEGKANLVAGGRYRPLTLVMFAVEVQLFGQKPFVGHVFNALFYGLTAVVLYLLLLKLFGPERDPARAYFVALSAAFLFAAHPIHTEVVANIKGRDEIAALLGSLAALYFSLRAYSEKKPLLNILAGVVFFLGLMSKENAITFLAIVPLAYYFFTQAKPGKIAVQLLPFLAAAVVFIIIRGSILGFSLGTVSMELMNNPFLKLESGQWVHFTLGEKMATVAYTLGKYLSLLFFPHPLTHDYYPRQVGIVTWNDPQAVISLVAYIGLAVYAVRGLFKKDPLSFAVFFYLITLSIVSNVVFPVGVPMAERLVFMPSAGFCLAIALIAYKLVVGKKFESFRQLYPALGVLAVVTLVFGILTIARNPAWKNNYTLFTTDIKTSPKSAKLRNAVGGELIAQSAKVQDENQKQKMLQEAASHLQEAIRIHPTYKNAYLLLGNCYNYLKHFETSIQNYRKALELDPNYKDAINNLGITYRDAGRFYGEQQNDLAKALQYLLQAYELRPEEYETLRLLGVAYGIGGNSQKALEFFSKAAEIQPDDADALYNLGTAYLNAGMADKGNENIQKALEIDPNVAIRRQNE
jgi:protein O-mannosyl-transferase